MIGTRSYCSVLRISYNSDRRVRALERNRRPLGPTTGTWYIKINIKQNAEKRYTTMIGEGPRRGGAYFLKFLIFIHIIISSVSLLVNV